MLTIASDKYFVVVGIGVTGMSVVRYLTKNDFNFCVMDNREQPPGLDEMKENYTGVPIYLEHFDVQVLENAYAIVLSPGVSREEPAIANAIEKGVRITSDVELFLQNTAKRVVGVTGSNGKTTVVSMLGKIAEAEGIPNAVGGNIGAPVLDLLDENVELFILELSSFQLENIERANLYVACVLNVSLDHMDRHHSMEAYFRAKQRIYFSASHVVYNLDDRLTIPPNVEGVHRAGFTLNKSHEENETQYWFEHSKKNLMCDSEVLLAYNDMRIKGLHNVANALAIFALCDFLEISRDSVVHVLLEFQGLPHRCEWVAERNAVTFINDSKATNVGATEAAICGLQADYKNIYLVAGGDGKGADFSALGKLIRQYVTRVVLIGRDADDIAKAIADESKVIRALNMHAAVELGATLAKEGDVVLLSPACASFDMYSGYEARGSDFIAAVAKVCA